MTVNRRSFAVALLLCTTTSAAFADQATWTQKILTPETALKAAVATQAECQKRGWQVTVTIADPSGLPQVMLRDRFAGWHTVEAANGKARTAASWRETTTSLAARITKPDAAEKGIMSLPGVVMVGGGTPITSAGQLVGAIGVSGAPGGDNDDLCAKAGLAAIEDDLAF